MTEPLHGCVDDAKKIRQFLIGQWTASEAALAAISDDFLADDYGYSEDDVILLTDNQTDPERIPTRENMVSHHSSSGSRVVSLIDACNCTLVETLGLLFPLACQGCKTGRFALLAL